MRKNFETTVKAVYDRNARKRMTAFGKNQDIKAINATLNFASNDRAHGIIKNFNLKEVFCHKDECQAGSNPDKHDNCCYAKWTRKRKSLEKALDVADNLYHEIENYEDEELSNKQINILNNKSNKIFIDFCEKQYQENLKINYTIQEYDNKAIYLLKYSI